MKGKWIAAVVLFAGCSLSGALRADPLNYLWRVPGDGMLDGVAFTDPDPFNYVITLSMTADSANVVTAAGGSSFEISGPMSVTVAGVGTDTITDAMTIYEYGGYFTMFGLKDTTTGSQFNIAAGGGCFICPPYDSLAGPTGPISGRGNPPSGVFNTQKGSLVFRPSPQGPFLFYPTPTLEITKASSTAVTPEPSSLVLLGSGLVGLVGVLRRRFIRAES